MLGVVVVGNGCTYLDIGRTVGSHLMGVSNGGTGLVGLVNIAGHLPVVTVIELELPELRVGSGYTALELDLNLGACLDFTVSLEEPEVSRPGTGDTRVVGRYISLELIVAVIHERALLGSSIPLSKEVERRVAGRDIGNGSESLDGLESVLGSKGLCGVIEHTGSLCTVTYSPNDRVRDEGFIKLNIRQLGDEEGRILLINAHIVTVSHNLVEVKGGEVEALRHKYEVKPLVLFRKTHLGAYQRTADCEIFGACSIVLFHI